MHPIPKLFGALACCALLWAARPALAVTDTEALRAAVAAERARPAAPQLPRAAFLAPPAVRAVHLSPDGRQLAWLREQDEVRSLWLMPTTGGPARALLARTDAEQLHWSRDGRWLFLRGPRAWTSVPLSGSGGVRIALGGAEQRAVMQLDASQPAAVVLRERVRDADGERWRLVRMDARGRRRVLREDRHWIHDVAFDAHGRLAALTRFDGDADELYRVDAAGDLQPLWRLRPMEQARLLGVDARGGLLMRGDIGGDLRRLVRLDRDGTLHTLHVDPRAQADLDEVVLDPASGEPRVVSYRSTVAASYGLGPAAVHVDAIRRRFPGRDLGIEVAADAGRGAAARWLVAERDSSLREPRWHLYDPRSGAFTSLRLAAPRAAPALPEPALARKIPLAYRASDGLRVRGFLLLPPGADPARLPLIAQVHGGPINHFRPEFDGLAQLLVNRGYAVFQSNFRGSTGHGRAYTFAAQGDYGNGRVQRDIVEGVRYLLGQGIGDPQRVGIVGHSFGGYATLLGVTFAPELFKVGVAGAPPADFGWSMRWLLEAGDQGVLPDRSLRATLRALAVDPGDTATLARLHAQSPVANAARLRRPLLILAGGADRVVAIREVVHYAATLRALGKPVSLYVEPGGGHSPDHPLAMEAYAYLMETMLHAHLGGAAPARPSPRLRASLARNLRLAGPEFGGATEPAPAH